MPDRLPPDELARRRAEFFDFLEIMRRTREEGQESLQAILLRSTLRDLRRASAKLPRKPAVRRDD